MLRLAVLPLHSLPGMSPGSGESREEVPDLGPPPHRLTLDVETVCHLGRGSQISAAGGVIV